MRRPGVALDMSVLAYDLTGPPAAPVLVLGGSLGTTRAMWQPQLDALTATHRVLRYDHLGHGGSQEPRGPYTIEQLGAHLIMLLDELELPVVSYAGVSLGGMVGMWVAAHHPARFDRLALICTSAYLPPAAGWHQRAATVREQGIAAVADTIVGRWVTNGDPKRLQAMIRSTPSEGYASCCEAIAEMDLRPALPRITAQTLVIAGEQDLATPPEHGELITAMVPGARLEVLPDSAHLASWQHPELVNPLLHSHLTG
jgi:3-oxoadipate enol-lactonase